MPKLSQKLLVEEELKLYSLLSTLLLTVLRKSQQLIVYLQENQVLNYLEILLGKSWSYVMMKRRFFVLGTISSLCRQMKSTNERLYNGKEIVISLIFWRDLLNRGTIYRFNEIQKKFFGYIWFVMFFKPSSHKYKVKFESLMSVKSNIVTYNLIEDSPMIFCWS